MRAILVKNDLWAYVSGATVKPTSSSEQIATWARRDEKAKADLTLAMSPSELSLIDDSLETSRDIWLKLQATYQSKGPARKVTLLKRITLSRIKESDNIRTHLAECFDAVNKMKEIGLQINEDFLAILLLYSLPEPFENYRCAMETRDELPKPEILRVKIVEEYESRKAKEESSEQSVLYARKK